MSAPLLQLEDVTRQYPLPRERLWQSWRQLAWPQLLSLADIPKLADRRVVRIL